MTSERAEALYIGEFLVVGTILCIAGCLSASLSPTC